VRHDELVNKAVQWLRRYHCGIVLSEQICANGEAPDAIGWKGKCHSVLVECKVSRADFLADRHKSCRAQPDAGVGCERYYLVLRGVATVEGLPQGWGLLEYHGREFKLLRRSAKTHRSAAGFMSEMNLLLASLRRVEVRIEPQTITDFLKWKNRMAEYNGGAYPQGLVEPALEDNLHLTT
jgi:hypothetical protein